MSCRKMSGNPDTKYVLNIVRIVGGRKFIFLFLESAISGRSLTLQRLNIAEDELPKEQFSTKILHGVIIRQWENYFLENILIFSIGTAYFK